MQSLIKAFTRAFCFQRHVKREGPVSMVTFSAGVRQARGEVLALEDLLHHVVSIHPRGIHPLQLRLHRVLLHWVSGGSGGDTDKLDLKARKVRYCSPDHHNTPTHKRVAV